MTDQLNGTGTEPGFWITFSARKRKSISQMKLGKLLVFGGKAYLATNLDLAKAREESCQNLCLGEGEFDAPGMSLDLITNHYDKAMEPVFKFWVFDIWRCLHWSVATIRRAIWTIKRKFLCL